VNALTKILLLAVTAACFGAESDLPSRIQRVEKGLLPEIQIKGVTPWTIQERMKHHKAPGVSIAVINDFKVEWAKTYGVTDIETREPVSERILFQAGSISKPVAAMVALKKVEQGKISLDENINDKLTSWKLPDNEFTAIRRVTLAHLLSHSAGLTVHGFPGYEVGAPLPTLPQILNGTAPANTAAVRVNMEPGTKFRYSGGGTTIMQLALMDIEGKPFPIIAQETVLGPLQMRHSTYSQPLPDDIRKMAASGHRGDGNVLNGKIHIYPEMAAAGLWTTPADLAKFAIEIQLSLVGKSNRVLSKESAIRMLTPGLNNVGLGFFLIKKGKATYFLHGGADEGFRALLVAHKEKGQGAVVMVNSDNGQIMDEIVRAIAKEYQWEEYLPESRETVSIDPKELDHYVGRYLVNPDRVLTITKENNRLFAEPTSGTKEEIFPLAGGKFIRTDSPVEYSFVKNPGSSAATLEIRFQDTNSTAPRITSQLVPYELLLAGKTVEAQEGYRQIRKEKPGNNAVSETRLNDLGYGLLFRKKYREAIAIFQINTEFYPQSSNVHDSLGEAYMLNGDKEVAAKSYRKALELNPKSANAIKMLKKLEP
jgi:CubicO group peptidase (beta-lactamase class C family)